ncbi:MAG TPA: VOC family protein [Bacillales bacterium]|nr:VOC family protein [Bacillales bacterium]
MIYEITIQVRVEDFEKGQKWYETLLNKEPDFIPHEGFAEWELIPGCWLQAAEGTPAKNSGPLRLGVTDIEAEKDRLVKELNVEPFEIHGREGVPARWATFTDPWGNRIGFFEDLNEEERNKRIQAVKDPK